MNSNSTKGLFLTLLMLWLVLLAAAVFLVIARGRMQDTISQLESENATAESDRRVLGEILATQEAVSADAQAERDEANSLAETRTAENTSLMQEIAAADAAASTAIEDRNAAQAAVAQLQTQLDLLEQTPPEIRVSSTAVDNLALLGSDVTFFVSATDLFGLATVILTVDEERFVFEPEAATVYVDTVRWTPTETGDFLINATATNTNGLASAPMTMTLRISDVVASNDLIRQQIEEQIETLRGLESGGSVDPLYADEATYQQYANSTGFVELDNLSAENLAIVYNAFNLLPDGFLLPTFQAALQAERTGAFYDPDSDLYVVPGSLENLSDSGLPGYARGYMEAVQDQVFGLSTLLANASSSDAALALQAWAAGEATLVHALYDPDLSLEELAAAELAASTLLNDAATPAIFREEYAFLYEEGVQFADARYQEGGNEALDAVWAALPLSTEQLLHPESSYPDDPPDDVQIAPLAATLGNTYQLVTEDTLGELRLRVHLAEFLDETEVDEAATGWGGDRFAVYYGAGTDSTVLVWELTWDSPEDQAQFVAAYTEYAGLAYGVNVSEEADASCWTFAEIVCITELDDSVIIVRAPVALGAFNLIEEQARFSTNDR